MPNTVYDNFFLSNTVEDQLNSHLDLQRFCVINNTLEGNLAKVFANQKKHIESVEKKIRADVLKETPKPEGGNGSETMTKEKFLKMTTAEQYKYSVEHPEEYKKLYGGN